MLYYLSIGTKYIPILKFIYYIKLIIEIILIVVPIILVIMGTIDLLKAIFNNDDKNPFIKTLINRILITICIIFIMPITNLTLSLLGQTKISETVYYASANKRDIEKLEQQKQLEDEIKRVEEGRKKKEEKVKKIIEQNEKIFDLVNSKISDTKDPDTVKNMLNENSKLTEEISNDLAELKVKYIKVSSVRINLYNIKNNLKDEDYDIKSLLKQTTNDLNEMLKLNNSDSDNKIIKSILDNIIKIDIKNMKQKEIQTIINNQIEQLNIFDNSIIKSIDQKCNNLTNKMQEVSSRVNEKKEVPIETTGLPSSDTIPSDSSSSSIRDKIVSTALKYVGNRYVFGGNSLTNGIDCSGFTQQIYASVGIKIPRTTWGQYSSGKHISVSALRKGDLIYTTTQSHVVIYMGNGKVVHAATTKRGIVTDNISYNKKLTKAATFIND